MSYSGSCAKEGPLLFHIAVPIYSSNPELVQRTLRSLLAQQAVIDDTARLRVDIVGRNIEAHDARMYVALAPDIIRYEDQHGTGQYQAVAQALRDSEADFISYLGAGDTYEPQAFSAISEVYRVVCKEGSIDNALWIVGRITSRRNDGLIVRSLLPLRYQKKYFVSGLHFDVLPTIQQESCMWSGILNSRIQWDQISSWQLAGDYALWIQLSQMTNPVVVDAILGSFLWHGNNRSQEVEKYRDEVRSMTHRPSALLRSMAYLEKVLWALPDRIKSRYAGGIYRYTWPEGPWVKRL